VPQDVIRQRCGLYLREGNPAQRDALLHDDDFTIVAKYQAEYRGLVQYYLLAQDVFRLGKLQWVMETSLPDVPHGAGLERLRAVPGIGCHANHGGS